MNTAARELYLYVVNDSGLYRQQTGPIIKNLAHKMAKGIYDPKKALILWGYLAESGAKKYVAGTRDVWHQIFSPQDRRFAAAELAAHYADEVKETTATMKAPKKNPSPRARANKEMKCSKCGLPYGSADCPHWDYEGPGIRKNPSPRARANKKARRFVESYYKGRTPTRKNVERKLNMARHYFLAKKNPRSFPNIEKLPGKTHWTGYADGAWKITGSAGSYRAVRQDGRGWPLFAKTLDEMSKALKGAEGMVRKLDAAGAKRNPKRRTFSKLQLAAQKRFGKMAKARAKHGPHESRRERAYRALSGPWNSSMELVHGRKARAHNFRTVRAKKNPVGFQCMLSTVRNGRKFWYTGKTLDTDKKAGVVMSEKTARVQAYKLAQKTGWPFAIESC